MSARKDLKLSLSVAAAAADNSESEEDMRSSISSSPSSCVSVEDSAERSPAKKMVLAACPRCLMYVMLHSEDPKCPQCKNPVLNYFMQASSSNAGAGAASSSSKKKN